MIKCDKRFTILYYVQCKQALRTRSCVLSKADAVLEGEKYFYRVFSTVKYSYLPIDTFRKYVEMDVTCRKLAF